MTHSPDPGEVLIDREQFLTALYLRFPLIAAKIGDIEHGLLHPEMAVVSQATRDAIAADDWQQVAEQIEFIDQIFARDTEAICNAVYVSYLENVLLGETTPKFLRARTLLTPKLLQAMLELELESHFEKLGGSTRGA